jgi:hypothetical protein
MQAASARILVHRWWDDTRRSPDRTPRNVPKYLKFIPRPVKAKMMTCSRWKVKLENGADSFARYGSGMPHDRQMLTGEKPAEKVAKYIFPV